MSDMGKENQLLHLAVESESETPRWSGLFRFGSIAAFIIALLLLGEIFVYALIPDRSTPEEIFALFRNSPFAGLLFFDLLGMISYLLYIPVVLSFYVVLRKNSESLLAFSLVLFIIGVAVFFANNTGFSVLSLSHRYELATTQEEKAMLLASCRTMITLFDVNAFMISYVIVSASWAIMGFVMLQSPLFGRFTAWAGIIAGLSGIVAEVIENTLKELLPVAIGFYFAAIVFILLWVVMAGRRLYRMG